MKDKRATLEVIAPSVEEAVEKGLADLGLPAEAVDVEILDQGSRGLFGLGSRHARIRLAVKSGDKQGSPAEVADQTVPEEIGSAPDDLKASPQKSEVAPAAQAVVSLGEELELQIARETVSELLDTMKVHAMEKQMTKEAEFQSW
jgi:spoIIIJ-associated protein